VKFIDEAVIKVQAGRGGPGARSFWREKYVPLGGPDGGNGGAGGDVIIVADRNKLTLLDFKHRPIWKAQSGAQGEGANKDGRSGEDLKVFVPVGTQILRDDESRELIADLDHDGQEFILAKGGRGGKGNAFFKSPTNRAPEHFQPGEEGEGGAFVLSLKLVADVGLVGFPNAGKSTLISRISAARPKIADYPFTTLIPNLGVVQARQRSFVVADIPGLIPGAHEGRGLGITFLKHIERTRVIAHLIDPNQYGNDGEKVSPLTAFDAINHELGEFSAELAKKPQVVVITKADTITEPEELAAVKHDFEARGFPVLVISAVVGTGIQELIDYLAERLWTSPPTTPPDDVES
jgi:GTP-binding protein